MNRHLAVLTAGLAAGLHALTAAGVAAPLTTAAAAPTTELHMDVPAGPSAYQGFTVGGWAIDAAAPDPGTGVDAIHVWAFPIGGGSPIFMGATTDFHARPDVADARGARFRQSGFNVKTVSVAPGDYQVVTYAHSTVSQQFDAVALRRLTVAPAIEAVIQITNIADGARVNGETTFTGYAFDPRAATDLGVDAVHVYVYPNWGSGEPPQFAGLATYGTINDPSLGAQFGSQFELASLSMEVTMPPGSGTHLVAFFAHSAVDGSFKLATRLVTVPPAQFLLSVDRPQPNALFSGAFTIGGWAIDRSTVDVPGDGSGIEYIQVYAYPVEYPPGGGAPIFVCGPSDENEDLPNGGIVQRPDVAAMFGARFLNSGWTCPVNAPGAATLPPAAYDLKVYVYSERTQQYSSPTLIPLIRFTVQ